MDSLKTVKDLCSELQWNISELSRQAGISWQAAQNAFNQETTLPRTRRDICSALTEALEREVKTGDIEWVKQ